MEKKKLPIYKLVINPKDKSGVDYIALVDEPAIERYFLKFSDEKPFRFQANEDQRIVSGPAMIPDLPIYRRADGARPEHLVLFDVDTVKQIALKFFRTQSAKNINLMHNESDVPDLVYLFESFLIDSSRGISAPTDFKDLPQGTWFVSLKVDNPDVWEKIKKDEFQGFSVEGLFDYEKTEEEVMQQQLEELAELLK